MCRAFFLFLAIFSARSASADSWQQDFTRALKNGAAIAADSRGTILFEHRADDPFIPASILKVATVACGLAGLGNEYRFQTEFFTGPDETLYVRGFGDPTLVSEELAKVAAALAPKLTRVKRVVLDDTLFTPGFADGQSVSTNPYDAVNGALVANFNTVFLVRRGKTIESAEPQTPLVPIARELAPRMKTNPERINIGTDRLRVLSYFGQLLTAFLQMKGTRVDGASILPGVVPNDAAPLYTHRSSTSLREASSSILEFSTNFSANQIFLLLGASRYGTPATFEKGARALSECLRNEVGWQDFAVYEGAGLSRKNRVTARGMLSLLDYFEPNASLLPVEQHRFRAKTGSLRGVGTLAGYVDVPGRGAVRFVIMVNDNVPFGYKFTLAEKLYAGLAASRSKLSGTE